MCSASCNCSLNLTLMHIPRVQDQVTAPWYANSSATNKPATRQDGPPRGATYQSIQRARDSSSVSRACQPGCNAPIHTRCAPCCTLPVLSVNQLRQQSCGIAKQGRTTGVWAAERLPMRPLMSPAWQRTLCAAGPSTQLDDGTHSSVFYPGRPSSCGHPGCAPAVQPLLTDRAVSVRAETALRACSPSLQSSAAGDVVRWTILAFLRAPQVWAADNAVD